MPSKREAGNSGIKPRLITYNIHWQKTLPGDDFESGVLHGFDKDKFSVQPHIFIVAWRVVSFRRAL